MSLSPRLSSENASFEPGFLPLPHSSDTDLSLHWDLAVNRTTEAIAPVKVWRGTTRKHSNAQIKGFQEV